ncbi:hypothetical protein M9Y10_031858 [Tritrichomonas musculus]|uniref:Uncharacterized protein n=1 Tax=Tritrichomonas musculus TaxID=1915356 RepID=A0ABR2H126_9EUKA
MKRRHDYIKKIIIEVRNTKEVFEMNLKEEMIDSKEERKHKAQHINNAFSEINIDDIKNLTEENKNKIDLKVARNKMLIEEKPKRKRRFQIKTKTLTKEKDKTTITEDDNADDAQNGDKQKAQYDSFLRLTNQNFLIHFDDEKETSTFKTKTKESIIKDVGFESSDSFFFDENEEYLFDYLS